MEFIKTKFDSAWLIKPKVWQDHRGFFFESFTQKEFVEHGIDIDFVQDNHSLSVEVGVVRGLHFQKPPCAQSKLVRVIHGAVFDVIVDLRKQSPTFGMWEGFTLSAANFQMLFVPQGFAHGFCTIEPNTQFLYKVDNYYSAPNDAGIRFDDPALSISWPVEKPILSTKDSALPLLLEIESPF